VLMRQGGKKFYRVYDLHGKKLDEFPYSDGKKLYQTIERIPIGRLLPGDRLVALSTDRNIQIFSRSKSDLSKDYYLRNVQAGFERLILADTMIYDQDVYLTPNADYIVMIAGNRLLVADRSGDILEDFDGRKEYGRPVENISIKIIGVTGVKVQFDLFSGDGKVKRYSKTFDLNQYSPQQKEMKERPEDEQSFVPKNLKSVAERLGVAALGVLMFVFPVSSRRGRSGTDPLSLTGGPKWWNSYVMAPAESIFLGILSSNIAFHAAKGLMALFHIPLHNSVYSLTLFILAFSVVFWFANKLIAHRGYQWLHEKLGWDVGNEPMKLNSIATPFSLASGIALVALNFFPMSLPYYLLFFIAVTVAYVAAHLNPHAYHNIVHPKKTTKEIGRIPFQVYIIISLFAVLVGWHYADILTQISDARFSSIFNILAFTALLNGFLSVRLYRLADITSKDPLSLLSTDDRHFPYKDGYELLSKLTMDVRLIFSQLSTLRTGRGNKVTIKQGMAQLEFILNRMHSILTEDIPTLKWARISRNDLDEFKIGRMHILAETVQGQQPFTYTSLDGKTMIQRTESVTREVWAYKLNPKGEWEQSQFIGAAIRSQNLQFYAVPYSTLRISMDQDVVQIFEQEFFITVTETTEDDTKLKKALILRTGGELRWDQIPHHVDVLTSKTAIPVFTRKDGGDSGNSMGGDSKDRSWKYSTLGELSGQEGADPAESAEQDVQKALESEANDKDSFYEIATLLGEMDKLNPNNTKLRDYFEKAVRKYVRSDAQIVPISTNLTETLFRVQNLNGDGNSLQNVLELAHAFGFRGDKKIRLSRSVRRKINQAFNYGRDHAHDARIPMADIGNESNVSVFDVGVFFGRNEDKKERMREAIRSWAEKDEKTTVLLTRLPRWIVNNRLKKELGENLYQQIHQRNPAILHPPIWKRTLSTEWVYKALEGKLIHKGEKLTIVTVDGEDWIVSAAYATIVQIINLISKTEGRILSGLENTQRNSDKEKQLIDENA
ncbi:MAG: hypothetical protein HYY63_05000, partial [Elusimicrobia bacterium]|nr:hypothetical protein [Elusimicrobiota bacterium]